MSRIAEHACNDCQYIFPANQLKRHSYTTETRSRSKRRDRHGNLISTGETTHEHNHQIWLCWACADARRRAAVRNFFALVFLAALVFGGLYVYGLTHPPSPKPTNLLNETAIEGDSSEPAEITETPEARATLHPDEQEAVPSKAGQTRKEEPGTPEATPTSDPVAGTPLQGSPNFSDLAGAQSAALKAFSSGKPQRWKDGSLKGWATPSEEVVAGCRTVVFSLDTDPDRASSPQKVCG